MDRHVAVTARVEEAVKLSGCLGGCMYHRLMSQICKICEEDFSWFRG